MTTDAPKPIKKATGTSENKTPTTPLHTTFGCPHVKSLLQQARQQALDQYAKIIAVLRNDDNLADRLHKTDGAPPAATGGVTYLCLQCPLVTKSRDRHHKAHGFSVESSAGYVRCHECKDFVYDPTFEDIRTASSKRRKVTETPQEGEKKLIANNTASVSCAATGLRGFYNMGQTCFMSVILQSLIHNPFIRTFYLGEGHKASEYEHESCTSCVLDEIFTDFYGLDKHEGYGAVHMLQACWKKSVSLAGYSQQDAHEFLGFILNSLHEAEHDEEAPDNLKDAKDCDCVIHQIFCGLMKSTVTCDDCKNTTTAIDPFMDLSLDIKATNFITKKKTLKLTNSVQTVKEAVPMDLTECLDRYTGFENLSSDSYQCRRCNGERNAKKKLTLTRLPPVLPIHLKRFSHSKANGQSNKVDSKVRFSLELDMTPYVVPSAGKARPGNKAEQDSSKPGADDDEDTIDVKTPNSKPATDGSNVPPVYELSSVIVHKGKIDNGHYISYSQQDGQWFRFDDSMVVQVDVKEVLNAEAYMLFYVIAEF